MSAPTNVELPVDLVERAMRLPPEAMRKLAGLLLDAADGAPDDPELVRKEWQQVIADRIQGYLDGTIPAVDAREQLERVKRRLAEKHAP